MENDPWAILNYEIQMYFGARILQSARFSHLYPEMIKVLESAMTEVKLLHIRILVEIFLKRKHKDDINIDDLLPAWRENNRAVLDDLKTAYTTDLAIGRSSEWYLNKFLAHPDRERGFGFDWAPIVKQMDPPLRRVFSTLPSFPLQFLDFVRRNYPSLTRIE